MKLKLFIWLIAFLFLLAQCSSKKSEKEFLRKLNFEFLSFKNYNSVSLVRLFDSSFIRRKKQKGTKPSIVSINQKVKSIEQSSSSVIEYYLEIPERSKLVFSAFSLKPVIFKISASTQEGGEDLIFSEKYVSGENPKLQQIELLPYQEKIVKLSFKLEGEGRGYWLEPKIIFKKEELNWDDYSRFWTELRKKAEKWNLIYIVLDAARPDHFSCYGYPKKTTPYIDQFSKESLIFDNAFSQAVYTLASTSSLFTGLYPISHYVVMDYQKLPDRFFTLAEAFSEKEYLTLAEISNPYVSSKFNMHQGFSFFKRNWKTEKIFLNSETKDLIKKENKRFFLYLHYTPPHAPYDPPLRFKKKFISSIRKTDIGLTEYLKKVEEGEIELKREDLNYLKNLYDANLNYVDYYVGRVIELLKKEGWYQNSVIIITSDHGEALYEHQKLQHNSTVYEEMIRIPLIIKFPPTANIEPQRISNLVEMIDLTATFFDLFNLPQKMDYQLEGKSILPLIFSPHLWEKRFVYSRTVIPLSHYCVRNERYKYIFDLNLDTQESIGQLFDLKKDPKERINIAPQNQFLAFYFHQRLLEHLSSAQELMVKEEEKYIELDKQTLERLRSLGYVD